MPNTTMRLPPPKSGEASKENSRTAGARRRRALPLRRKNLPLLMLMAREGITAYFRPLFREFGLTEQQYRILRVLYENGELSIGQLSTKCFILGPSLTGILQRMTESGLTVKRLDPDDTRRFYASLTKQGRLKFEAMIPRVEDTYSDLEARVGLDAINALYRELEQALARLSDQIPPVGNFP